MIFSLLLCFLSPARPAPLAMIGEAVSVNPQFDFSNYIEKQTKSTKYLKFARKPSAEKTCLSTLTSLIAACVGTDEDLMETVAVKIFEDVFDENSRYSFERESFFYKMMGSQSPFVLKLFGQYDLFPNQPIEQTTFYRWVASVNFAQRIVFIHSKKVVQQVLEAQNVMITKHDEGIKIYKIADFEKARIITETESVKREVSGALGYSIDWYNLGALLYFLSEGKPGFHTQSSELTSTRSSVETIPYDEFFDFVTQLMQLHVGDRFGNRRGIDAAAIKRHAFFKCVTVNDWTVLEKGDPAGILTTFKNSKCLNPY